MKKNQLQFTREFEISPEETTNREGVWVLKSGKVNGRIPANRLTEEAEDYFPILEKLQENETKAGDSFPHYQTLIREFGDHLFEIGKNSIDAYLDKVQEESPSKVEITYQFFTIEGTEEIGLTISDNGTGFPAKHLQTYHLLPTTHTEEKIEKKGSATTKEGFNPGERLGGAGQGDKLFIRKIAEMQGDVGKSNRDQAKGGGAVIEFRIPKQHLIEAQKKIDAIENPPDSLSEQEEVQQEEVDLSSISLGQSFTTLARMSSNPMIMLNQQNPQSSVSATNLKRQKLEEISSSSSSSFLKS